MKPWIITLEQLVTVLLLAPLAAGLVRKVKARLQGRVGPPVLLPYWTLLTLFRKETVVSSSASWVFRLVPYTVLASVLFTVLVLPLVGRGGVGAPLSHFAVLAGVWMIGAVFLVLGGIDAAGAFGGMGASREMTLAAFLEPSILVSFAAFALASGSTSVDGMLTLTGGTMVAHPQMVLALGGLTMAALGENSRYPVDNPATHLELTMVHEAMVLEYSGPFLALLELAGMVKLTVFSLLLANFLVPAGLATPLGGSAAFLIAPVAAAGKVVLVMAALGFLESSMAKLRFYGLQEYFFGALFLGFSALILSLLLG